MAKKAKHVACVHCRLGQERVLKQSFLGFYKFACEECEVESTYPLPTSYVAIYALSIVVAVVSGAMGQYRCGVLAAFGVIALAYNMGIYARSKAALAGERSKGQVVADQFK